jgi:Arc/MetJ family transcription regulator
LFSYASEAAVRTTVDLDEDLVKLAFKYTGITTKTQLLEEGLRSLVRRQAARELAAMGGTMPNAKPTPRRRFK